MNTQQPYAPPATHKPRFSNEQIVSMVLAAAGIGVTLIGVVLLLAMAAREGLLTPPVRVVGGAVLSGALAALAAWIRPRPGGRLGSVALLSTGAAAAFFDVVAVTRIYAWVPLGVGLALALLVGLAAGAQAVRWEERYLFHAVTVGVALLAPYLTQGDEFDGLSLVTFLTVLQLVGLVPELMKQWDETALVRTVPAVFAASMWALREQGTAPWTVLCVTAVIALVGAAGAVAADTTRRSTPLAAAAFVIAWIPLWIASATCDDMARAVVDLAALLVSGAVLCYLRRTVSMVRLAAVVVAAMSGLMLATTFSDGPWRAMPFVAGGLLLVVVHLRVRQEALGVTAGGMLVLGMALQQTSTSYLDLFYRSRAAELPMTVPTHGVLFLAFSCFTLLAVQGRNYTQTYVRGLLNIAGTAAVLGMGMVLVTALGTTHTGFFVAHLLITMLSLALAALVLTAGLRRPRYLAASMAGGMTLIGCALAKLFLFDLHYMGSVTKAFTFVGAGLVLLAAGTVYARTYAVVAARTKAGQIN